MKRARRSQVAHKYIILYEELHAFHFLLRFINISHQSILIHALTSTLPVCSSSLSRHHGSLEIHNLLLVLLSLFLRFALVLYFASAKFSSLDLLPQSLYIQRATEANYENLRGIHTRPTIPSNELTDLIQESTYLVVLFFFHHIACKHLFLLARKLTHVVESAEYTFAISSRINFFHLEVSFGGRRLWRMERPIKKARASVSTWNMYLYALWCADIAFWRACWLF